MQVQLMAVLSTVLFYTVNTVAGTVLEQLHSIIT